MINVLQRATRRANILTAAVGLVLLFSGRAQALSYITPTDASLLDRSDVVVIGTIERASADPARPLDASRYELRAEDVLKGVVGDGPIAISVPGGFGPARTGLLVVPGAPRFALAERVLLFLDRRAGNIYELNQFSLGAFHARTSADGQSLLQRDAADADATADDGSANAKALMTTPVLRSFDGFRDWLKARAAGRSDDSNYWRAAVIADAQQPKYLLEGLTSALVRWAEFDTSRSVTFYAGNVGQKDLNGGGYKEVQQAIAAWNDDPTSNVQYVYGGLTGVTAGGTSADGYSQILFNDPNNEIPGSFDCSAGGVIATTRYRYGGALSLGGILTQPMTEADIIVQDGAGCILAGNGGLNAAQVFAHELGHSLGLGHSCGDAGTACVTGSIADAALMRAKMHNDARGATLGVDDRNGIAALYPVSGAAVTPPPVSGASTGSAGSGSASNSGGGGALDVQTLAAMVFALLLSVVLRQRQTLQCLRLGLRLGLQRDAR